MSASSSSDQTHSRAEPFTNETALDCYYICEPLFTVWFGPQNTITLPNCTSAKPQISKASTRLNNPHVLCLAVASFAVSLYILYKITSRLSHICRSISVDPCKANGESRASHQGLHTMEVQPCEFQGCSLSYKSQWARWPVATTLIQETSEVTYPSRANPPPAPASHPVVPCRAYIVGVHHSLIKQ